MKDLQLRRWWIALIALLLFGITLSPTASYATLAQRTIAQEPPTPGIIFLPMVGNDVVAGQTVPEVVPEMVIEHDHANHYHPDNRFVAIAASWPPQPRRMEDIEIAPIAEQSVQATALQNAAVTAAQAPTVQDALGDRFVYLGSEALARKGNPANGDFQNVYYSHSNNKTIHVTVNGDTVKEITKIAPAVYQPPLGEQEVVDAIDIARVGMVDAGYARAADLEGFGILALPTDGRNPFFDNRVVYVSFHEHVDARPEYVVWVDLTHQVVTQSREE